MSKWYLANLDILKYEEDEVDSKTFAKNGEYEMGDLNRRMNSLKIEERKSRRGDKEIWKRKWINCKEEREVTNHSQYSRVNLKFRKILYRLYGLLLFVTRTVNTFTFGYNI